MVLSESGGEKKEECGTLPTPWHFQLKPTQKLWKSEESEHLKKRKLKLRSTLIFVAQGTLIISSAWKDNRPSPCPACPLHTESFSAPCF